MELWQIAAGVAAFVGFLVACRVAGMKVGR